MTTAAYPICLSGAQFTHTAIIAIKHRKTKKNEKMNTPAYPICHGRKHHNNWPKDIDRQK